MIKKDIRPGLKIQSKSCGEFEVLTSPDVDGKAIVKFHQTGFEYAVNYQQIIRGTVYDPLVPKLHNVGYLGVGPYNSGRNKQAFTVWTHMLRRCYSTESRKFPNYEGCSVADSWHNFQNYCQWYLDNDVKSGWDVDKDILVPGNKIYSATTCAPVPREINVAVNSVNIKTKEVPGVRKRDNRFEVQLSVDGKTTFIGCFMTLEEATGAYLTAKVQRVRELANKYRGELRDDVHTALLNWKPIWSIKGGICPDA